MRVLTVAGSLDADLAQQEFIGALQAIGGCGPLVSGLG